SPRRDYKVSGSPDAPVVCEIYSDYECPACGLFYSDVFPRLLSEYVMTGKVRVVHRDFPLPMHRYSKLAARYANAAGKSGNTMRHSGSCSLLNSIGARMAISM